MKKTLLIGVAKTPFITIVGANQKNVESQRVWKILPEGRAPNNGRWLGSRYKWLQTLLFSRRHAETLLKFRDAWHAVSKGHHRGVEQFSQRSASQRGHWAVSSQTSLFFGAPLGTGDHQNFVTYEVRGNWIFAKFIHLLTLKMFVSLLRWGGITHVGPMLAWLIWLVTHNALHTRYVFFENFIVLGQGPGEQFRTNMEIHPFGRMHIPEQIIRNNPNAASIVSEPLLNWLQISAKRKEMIELPGKLGTFIVSTLSRSESSSPCFNQRPLPGAPERGLEGSTVTIETAKPQTSHVTWPSTCGRIANGEDKEDEFAGSLPDEQRYGLPPFRCTWPECFEVCPPAHHHG